MSRYIDEMTREELVSEVIGLVQAGLLCQHEVFDPTVLPRDRLRESVRLLRLRILREGRVDLGGVDLEGDPRPT